MKEKLKFNSEIYDLVVIGGGPAGMMAAGRAAELGHSVLLLEKNSTLGKKLLITGGGRCNVTNNKTDVRMLLKKYEKSEQFLFSAFSQFSVKETLEFFHAHGMKTKEENEGRMFPLSNKAESVWQVLIEYIKKGKVKIETGAEVQSLSSNKTTKNIHISLKEGGEIVAKACVVATGGTSRPDTGSTGDGYIWLKKLGHTIIENNMALVPLTIKDAWVKKLGGVSLQNIKLTIFQDGEKQDSRKGKLLFTHVGVSGPTILNMSREVGGLLKYGEVTIMLDLLPDLDPGMLKEKFQALLAEESNKKLKNTLSKLIPSAVVPVLFELGKVDGETPNHSVRTEDRKKLVALIKNIPLHVRGLLGKDKAVVSSGGVALEEVDFRTMESRIVPNLYLVGDVLNIDRPSGGYSLQLCWTTGYVAGSLKKKA